MCWACVGAHPNSHLGCRQREGRCSPEQPSQGLHNLPLASRIGWQSSEQPQASCAGDGVRGRPAASHAAGKGPGLPLAHTLSGSPDAEVLQAGTQLSPSKRYTQEFEADDDLEDAMLSVSQQEEQARAGGPHCPRVHQAQLPAAGQSSATCPGCLRVLEAERGRGPSAQPGCQDAPAGLLVTAGPVGRPASCCTAVARRHLSYVGCQPPPINGRTVPHSRQRLGCRRRPSTAAGQAWLQPHACKLNPTPQRDAEPDPGP